MSHSSRPTGRTRWLVAIPVVLLLAVLHPVDTAAEIAAGVNGVAQAAEFSATFTLQRFSVEMGRLVAEGTRRDLVSQLGQSDRIDVSATGDLTPFVDACAARPGVLGVDRRDGGVVVRVADGAAALAGIVGAAEHTGTPITGIELTEPDLEDVFLALTGKGLRD